MASYHRRQAVRTEGPLDAGGSQGPHVAGVFDGVAGGESQHARVPSTRLAKVLRDEVPGTRQTHSNNHRGTGAQRHRETGRQGRSHSY
jgi:hypothetical protein